MRARARLVVERDGLGHSVIRGLRSAAPLTLVPARNTPHALVRLVNSAAAPLGGDDLELTVEVGAGARLTLAGVAATLALPGHRAEPSRFTVRLELAEGAVAAYLPEPTVVTARARHASVLHAELAATAELHCREVLVLGRTGECPGSLTSTVHVLRAGCPVLRQTLTVGGPDSVAHLAGRRVLATDLRIDAGTPEPTGGDWWSLSPLAAGGSVTTVLATDAVAALRDLAQARAALEIH